MSATGIPDVVRTNAEAFAALAFVMVTCVDSDRHVVSMPWVARLRQRQPTAVISTYPLVITGSSLVESAQSFEVFFGFDELWIPTALPAVAPPENATIVAPLCILTDGVPASTAAYVLSASIRLGLGDGYGLNFVGQDLDLAARLGLT